MRKNQKFLLQVVFDISAIKRKNTTSCFIIHNFSGKTQHTFFLFVADAKNMDEEKQYLPTVILSI